MKQPLLIITAIMLYAQPLFASSSLTLDEALELSLRNHPQIVEAQENINGAEARTTSALANYYPQITAAADWNKGRTYITALESIKMTEVTTAALNLKQTLYDFGRTSGAVEAARSNRTVFDQALAITRQDLRLRVKSAFYLLIAAGQQVGAVSETVTARAAVLRQAQEFYNEGIRAKVDVARAEANYYAAKTALIHAENNRETARLELADAIGTSTLGDRYPVEPPAPSLAIQSQAIVQQEALLRRPELQQLDALKSSASANLRTARGSYLPILSGSAGVGYADRDLPPTGSTWNIGLNLTMPLFSGFSSEGQVREAVSAVKAIEARQRNLRLQIGKEAETARLSTVEASSRMVSTDKEIAATTESMKLAEGRYYEGVGTIIEVTDAQTQALEARTAHIQARYDYYTALARLERAVGSNVTTHGKE